MHLINKVRQQFGAGASVGGGHTKKGSKSGKTAAFIDIQDTAGSSLNVAANLAITRNGDATNFALVNKRLGARALAFQDISVIVHYNTNSQLVRDEK